MYKEFYFNSEADVEINLTLKEISDSLSNSEIKEIVKLKGMSLICSEDIPDIDNLKHTIIFCGQDYVEISVGLGEISLNLKDSDVISIVELHGFELADLEDNVEDILFKDMNNDDKKRFICDLFDVSYHTSKYELLELLSNSLL